MKYLENGHSTPSQLHVEADLEKVFSPSGSTWWVLVFFCYFWNQFQSKWVKNMTKLVTISHNQSKIWQLLYSWPRSFWQKWSCLYPFYSRALKAPMFICEVGVMSCLIMPHINLLVASFLFYFGCTSHICHGTLTWRPGLGDKIWRGHK